MKRSLIAAGLAVVVVAFAACDHTAEREPDAALVDAAADAPVDAAIDAAIDAAPDAGVSPCSSTTEMVLDLSPFWGSQVATLGDRLYVGSWRIENNVITGGEVLAFDPITRTSSTIRAAAGIPSLVVRGGWLYVADSAVHGSVWRYQPGQPIQVLAEDRFQPFPLTADATHVYWREGPSTASQIVRRAIAGGAIEPVVAANAYTMDVDDTNVYFAEFLAAMRRVPKGGGAAQPLAGGTATTKLELDGSDLDQLEFQQKLYRVPLGGGMAVTLATHEPPSRLYGFTRHGGYFYVSTEQGIERVPVGGGAFEPIATVNAARWNPAVLGDYLYWPGGNDNRIFRCRY